MIVFGIDPGLATTGYGILKSSNGKVKTLDYGVITTNPGESVPLRLKVLSKKLGILIKKYHPDIVVLEKIFFYKNVKTATVVGEAIGAIILTCANLLIDIVEYTPLEIKQAIVGYGSATKMQIQKMLKILLGLKEIPGPDDAADALAVALTYIHSYKLKDILNRVSLTS